MSEPGVPRSEFELEQRVIAACKSDWSNSRDGYPRNMGNLAKKAGVPSQEFSRVHQKLRRERRV